MKELSYHEIDFYKLKYDTAYKRIDISILFIEWSKLILKSSGITTFISSNQFLTTEYGENAQQILLEDYAVIKILDFGDLLVFEEALTYVSIFILTKESPQNFIYTRYDSIENAKNEVPQKSYEIEVDKISNDNWILGSHDGIELLNRLNQFDKLGSIGKSWAGLFTGLDKILMFEKDEVEKLGLEKEVVLPVIRAQNCFKYHCTEATKYVIRPNPHQARHRSVLYQPEYRRD